MAWNARPIIAVGDEFPNSEFNFSSGYFELIRLWNSCNQEPGFDLAMEVRRGNPAALRIWELWTWANNLYDGPTLNDEIEDIRKRLDQLNERVGMVKNDRGELRVQIDPDLFAKLKEQAMLHVLGFGKSPFEDPPTLETIGAGKGGVILQVSQPQIGILGKIIIQDMDKFAQMVPGKGELPLLTWHFKPLRLPINENEFWDWFKSEYPKIMETRTGEVGGFYTLQHGSLPWLSTTFQIISEGSGIRIEGWHTSYNGGKWWEDVEERATTWFIILADEGGESKEQNQPGNQERWQKFVEYLEVPADWEVLAAATPECLGGYASGWADVEMVGHGPGRIVFSVSQHELGMLGQVEIRKQALGVSRIGFFKPMHDIFSLTEEHRAARDAHFQKVIETYFLRLQQDKHVLTANYAPITGVAIETNEAKRGAPRLEDRVNVDEMRKKATQYRELIMKGKSAKIAAETVGYSKKTLDRWVRRLLDNNLSSG